MNLAKQLNDKLLEILDDYSTASYLHSEENNAPPDNNAFLAQIHQTYQDAGYWKHTQVGSFIDPSVQRLTGEEWYQRCLQLIEETLMVGDPKICARMIIAKAAGIK